MTSTIVTRNTLIVWNKQSKLLGEGGGYYKQIETTNSICLQIALLAIVPSNAQVNSRGLWQLGASRLACHTVGAVDFWGFGHWSWHQGLRGCLMWWWNMDTSKVLWWCYWCRQCWWARGYPRTWWVRVFSVELLDLFLYMFKEFGQILTRVMLKANPFDAVL